MLMKDSGIRFLIVSVFFMVMGTRVLHSAEMRDDVTHLSQEEFQQKIVQAGSVAHGSTENVSELVESVVIDIRTSDEFNRGHIKGAKHIPLASLLAKASLLDQYQDKDLIFYCHSGARVKRLTDYLQVKENPNQSRLFHLKGDMRAWIGRGLPVEK